MYMNDITPVMTIWQTLLIQSQELAARLPCTGLNPDRLALLSFDDLIGTLAYLKGRKIESEA